MAVKKLMQTNDPQEMQTIGRTVKNFEPVIWDGCKQLVVYRGLIAKFEQNPDLLTALIATETATPVECSSSDKIWGVGLGMYDEDVRKPSKWKGQNLLGFALQAVRLELPGKVISSMQKKTD